MPGKPGYIFNISQYPIMINTSKKKFTDMRGLSNSHLGDCQIDQERPHRPDCYAYTGFTHTTLACHNSYLNLYIYKCINHLKLFHPSFSVKPSLSTHQSIQVLHSQVRLGYTGRRSLWFTSSRCLCSNCS